MKTEEEEEGNAFSNLEKLATTLHIIYSNTALERGEEKKLDGLVLEKNGYTEADRSSEWVKWVLVTPLPTPLINT